MNRAILLPRRKPSGYHQANLLTRVIRCIGHYRYYRKQGMCISVSWALARHTI
jgi:hypothetical protein